MNFPFRYNFVPMFNGNISLAKGRLGVRPEILCVHEVSGETDKTSSSYTSKNRLIVHEIDVSAKRKLESTKW